MSELESELESDELEIILEVAKTEGSSRGLIVKVFFSEATELEYFRGLESFLANQSFTFSLSVST